MEKERQKRNASITPKYSGEYEKLNLFTDKSSVKLSSGSLSIINNGKTASVFSGIRYVGKRSGNKNAGWDFDGIKKLQSAGVTDRTAQGNIFSYKGKMIYLKPAYDKTDTSKWKGIDVINVEFINNSKVYN